MSEDGARLLMAVLSGREQDAVAAARAGSWMAAAEVAAWHGMLPALRHAVQQRGVLAQLPEDVRRQLDDAHVLAELRSEARRRQLHELLTTLAAAGVRVMTLKGAYLAEHVWDSPTLRPMTDVDLLVPSGPQAGAAHAALADLGYAPVRQSMPGHRHAPRLYRPGKLPVELHHTIEPCVSPSTLSVDSLWTRAAPCVIAGVPALGLCSEDLLLHLAVHMGRSHVLGGWLVSVYDVHLWASQLGPSANWDEVIVRARAAAAGRFVYAALALAQRAFGTAVPSNVLDALRGPADDVVVEHAIGLLGTSPLVIAAAAKLTHPHDSVSARLRRVGRALLNLRSAGHFATNLPYQVGERPQSVARDVHIARWTAFARLLASPGSARTAARQIAAMRAVRRWGALD
jgi:hypothetical protein